MGRRRRRQVLFFLLSIFFLVQLQPAPLTLASTATHGSRANAPAAITEAEEDGGAVESMMLRQKTVLGSRPPSCEGRCRAPCGRRCEAVQVPVTPHGLLRNEKKEKEKEASAAAVMPSSYDDRSNYKPLGWRCQCLHP